MHFRERSENREQQHTGRCGRNIRSKLSEVYCAGTCLGSRERVALAAAIYNIGSWAASWIDCSIAFLQTTARIDLDYGVLLFCIIIASCASASAI